MYQITRHPLLVALACVLGSTISTQLGAQHELSAAQQEVVAKQERVVARCEEQLESAESLSQIASIQGRLGNVATALRNSRCLPINPRVRELMMKQGRVARLLGERQRELATAAVGGSDTRDLPDLASHIAQVEKLREMYQAAQNFADDPATITSLAASREAAHAFLARLEEQYAHLALARVPQGQQLQLQLQFARRELAGFEQRAAAFVAVAPAQVDALLSKARRSLARASDGNAVAAVGEARSSIRQARGMAQSLAAFEPGAGAAVQAAVTDVVQRLEGVQVLRRRSLLSATAPPADDYRGADRGELRRNVTRAWRRGRSSKDVLGVHVGPRQWRSCLTATWDERRETWSFSEELCIAANVVVAVDDEVATVHGVEIRRNVETGRTRVELPDEDDRLGRWEMLRSNYIRPARPR